jgi:putative nucleotidyltransferase with HDIG domain
MNESNVEKNELDFSPVPIGKIPCNQALPADVYLKINEKFIKFKEAEDLIEEEKYNYFISKHLTVLFVKNSEVEKFVEKINEIVQNEIEAKVSEVGEEFRKVVEIQSKVQEKVYEVFLNEELSNEVVTILQNQVANFVSEIKDKNPSADIFAKISSMNNNIAEHSINVANLALLFGMVTGQSHQAVLENLYMGALFHDYGKAKIPASVLEKPNSVAYERAMASHPEAGVELLKSNPQINKQILSIVLEHHEQFAGVGYPKGKSGDAIYGLSKLVSMANIFDNIAMENKKNKANMYKAAIKVLEYDKGKQFDPSLMPRILDALKLGFGNYVREREIKA